MTLRDFAIVAAEVVLVGVVLFLLHRQVPIGGSPCEAWRGAGGAIELRCAADVDLRLLGAQVKASAMYGAPSVTVEFRK